MSQIKKILHMTNKGEYAIVHVQLSDGTEGEVYVGGTVSVRHDPEYDKIKVFVMLKP